MKPKHLFQFEWSFTQEQAALFFKAVSWQLPDRLGVPPTIATVFRKGEFEILNLLQIPLKQVLHGEQEYIFHKNLEPNKIYRCETILKNQHEKQGSSGKLRFLVFSTKVCAEPELLRDVKATETNESYVECVTNIIVRDVSK